MMEGGGRGSVHGNRWDHGPTTTITIASASAVVLAEPEGSWAALRCALPRTKGGTLRLRPGGSGKALVAQDRGIPDLVLESRGASPPLAAERRVGSPAWVGWVAESSYKAEGPEYVCIWGHSRAGPLPP